MSNNQVFCDKEISKGDLGDSMSPISKGVLGEVAIAEPAQSAGMPPICTIANDALLYEYTPCIDYYYWYLEPVDVALLQPCFLESTIKFLNYNIEGKKFPIKLTNNSYNGDFKKFDLEIPLRKFFNELPQEKQLELISKNGLLIMYKSENDDNYDEWVRVALNHNPKAIWCVSMRYCTKEFIDDFLINKTTQEFDDSICGIYHLNDGCWMEEENEPLVYKRSQIYKYIMFVMNANEHLFSDEFYNYVFSLIYNKEKINDNIRGDNKWIMSFSDIMAEYIPLVNFARISDIRSAYIGIINEDTKLVCEEVLNFNYPEVKNLFYDYAMKIVKVRGLNNKMSIINKHKSILSNDEYYEIAKELIASQMYLCYKAEEFDSQKMSKEQYDTIICTINSINEQENKEIMELIKKCKTH